LTLKNISHEKFVYQFIDNKNRIYKPSCNEPIEQLIYILNPFKESYSFEYEGEIIHLSFEILDDSHLYPFLDKDVFEKVFRLHIDCENQNVIEKFIKTGIHFAQKIFDNDLMAKNHIHIYQYSETDMSWEKYGDVTKRKIETIYLPLEQSKKVLNDIETFLLPTTKENYSKFGIPYHKTYCFYGPPGSGKTSLIHAICSHIQKNVCIYRFTNQTKDNDFASALRWIPKNSVFVLEDIDCIIKNRNETKGQISFSGVLNILDGLSCIECLLTFITTNHFLELDTAIKRPGRIDYILEFTYINKEQIYKMMDVFYPNEKNDFDIIYQQIKNYKMTVSHFQKYLFSLYPTGHIKNNLHNFIQEFLKYYSIEDSKLYV
jgi:chaperone BCS1